MSYFECVNRNEFYPEYLNDLFECCNPEIVRNRVGFLSPATLEVTTKEKKGKAEEAFGMRSLEFEAQKRALFC